MDIEVQRLKLQRKRCTIPLSTGMRCVFGDAGLYKPVHVVIMMSDKEGSDTYITSDASMCHFIQLDLASRHSEYEHTCIECYQRDTTGEMNLTALYAIEWV